MSNYAGERKDNLFQGIESYRAFMHYSSDLFSCHSSDGQFTFASPAAFTLLGYQPDELIGLSLYDLCHPFDQNKIKSLYLGKRVHQPERVYYRIQRKEGDYIWFESTCILAAGENSHEFLCISRDFTAHKTTEVELEENKEKYRLLVENFLDTVGIMTKDGFWIYINDTGRRLFGFTRTEEIIGKSFLKFIDPADQDTAKKHLLSHEKTDSFEVTILRSDLKKKEVEVKIIPTVYKERETYQIVIKDLTERKKTEDMMQRTEKLSVIGQLAAGIAHEIRNPLTAIKGFTQLVKQDVPNDYLDVVLMELERVENIVSDLLILAKPQMPHLEKVDVEKVLKDTISLFYSEALLNNVEIVAHVNLHECYIEGETDKLKQVYINLIKNGIEAMPDGGKIFINANQPDEKMVVTQVIDEGVGIPHHRIPKLGEPFYSTKEKGTGLGLMICNRIIKNHRGTLEIESEVNEGTKITICLPKYA